MNLSTRSTHKPRKHQNRVMRRILIRITDTYMGIPVAVEVEINTDELNSCDPESQALLLRRAMDKLSDVLQETRGGYEQDCATIVKR